MNINQEKLSIKELGILYKETRSEKTYNRLYKRVAPGVRQYIYKILEDADVTNQIFNETMCTVYDKIELYNTQWNISTWIYRIAYVNACAYLRAMRTSKTTPMSYFENSNDMDLTSKIEFQSIDGYKDSLELSEESEVISKQNSNLLDLVESLDSQFSNVLRDKFWENMKYEEIADKYEIPLQTVKNRIFRGKNMLNEKYVKLYGIPII